MTGVNYLTQQTIDIFKLSLRKSRDNIGEFFIVTRKGKFDGYAIELKGTMMRGEVLSEVRSEIKWESIHNPKSFIK